MSFGTPRPFSYITPMMHCANGSPLSAITLNSAAPSLYLPDSTSLPALSNCSLSDAAAHDGMPNVATPNVVAMRSAVKEVFQCMLAVPQEVIESLDSTR